MYADTREIIKINHLNHITLSSFFSELSEEKGIFSLQKHIQTNIAAGTDFRRRLKSVALLRLVARASVMVTESPQKG
jgi:hypothetical protein